MQCLFREWRSVGGSFGTASVASDPDVAATRAVPVEMTLSVQSDRRDADTSNDRAMRAHGVPREVAVSVEDEVFRSRRRLVLGIVRRHLVMDSNSIRYSKDRKTTQKGLRNYSQRPVRSVDRSDDEGACA